MEKPQDARGGSVPRRCGRGWSPHQASSDNTASPRSLSEESASRWPHIHSPTPSVHNHNTTAISSPVLVFKYHGREILSDSIPHCYSVAHSLELHNHLFDLQYFPKMQEKNICLSCESLKYRVCQKEYCMTQNYNWNNFSLLYFQTWLTKWWNLSCWRLYLFLPMSCDLRRAIVLV